LETRERLEVKRPQLGEMSEKRGLLKKKQALAAEGLDLGDRFDIVDLFELLATGKGEALKMREISALEGET
jgi:hypothetical protein